MIAENTTVAQPMRAKKRGDRVDDRALFARFLHGDDAAFMEFFDRHTPRLGRYCRKMVNDERAAEDILQDVWEKAIRMRGDDRPPPPNPVGLLYWMARNLCLNASRNDKRHAPLHGLAEERHPGSDRQDPTQLEELVTLALDRLPLSQREALILHFYSGYAFEEIAAMTGESPSAVRMRAWRGRRQIKRIVATLIELEESNQREEDKSR